ENRTLPSKVTMTIRKGDVFRHEVAGAGGWGDPLARDPAAVLKDVRNDMISLATARDAYGVLIDPQNWTVDTAATEKLRADIRTSRGWSEVPTVLWEDSPTRSESAA
ncbi:MAG: hydantoinase B/oxoprolinase family protein, partial [Candidatus Tectomicrobia bacterium]